jgi:ABC-type bacteriocin/lantibiotic exporter with double-glycine peptidase domain
MLVENLNCCFGLLTRKQRRDYWIVIFAMSLAALMELIGVGFVIPLVSILIDYESAIEGGYLKLVYQLLGRPEKNYFLLLVMVGGLVAVISGGVIAMLSIFINQRFLKGVNADISTGFYKYFTNQSLEDFYSRSSAEFVRNVNGVSERIADGIIGGSAIIISRSFQMIVVVIVLFCVDVSATFAIVTVILVSYLSVFLLVRGKVVALSKLNFEEIRELQQLIFGSYQGYRSIVVDGLVDDFVEKFSLIKRQAFRRSANIYVIGAVPKNVIETVGVSTLILCAYFIGGEVEGGHVFISILGVFGVAAYRLLPSAQQIYHALNRLTASLTVFQSVKGDCLLIHDNVMADVTGAKVNPECVNSIQFDAVSYAYNGKKVFDNLSINLQLKGFTRVLGNSGVGKSTLFELMLGMRAPSSGRIKVNSQALGGLDRKSWWSKVSYVSQNGYLFDGTIVSNVVVDGGIIDEDRLALVAYVCGLEFICDDTIFDGEKHISENGGNLSGGQVNRLLLARGLYKRSDIVFLDEAFSALDVNSAREILDRMSEVFFERPVLIISHRKEELPHCESVISMVRTGGVTQVELI